MSDNAAAHTTRISERWGEALNAGFVVIPIVLLRHQKRLNIENGEMVVILNLLMSWWELGDWPYPLTSTLAKRMGVSARTVQRHIESLEKKGLIERLLNQPKNEGEGKVTRYDLSKIVTELKWWGKTTFAAQRPETGAREKKQQTTEFDLF